MRISDVRMRKVNGFDKLRATCSIVFDEMLVLHDIRVIEGANGLFVSMPRRKSGNEYRDVAHPITTEARNLIQQAVLGVYRELARQEPAVQPPTSALEEPSMLEEAHQAEGASTFEEESAGGEERLPMLFDEAPNAEEEPLPA